MNVHEIFKCCIDCTRRRIGCKPGCKDYKEARAKLDAVNAARRAAYAKYDLIASMPSQKRRARLAKKYEKK